MDKRPRSGDILLKKIIAVRGIGAFRSYGASGGDLSFRRFTALWGPNAVGKSTLCDIFRSYSTGDAAPILGRRSLAAGAPPEVELLFQQGKRCFRNGAWDTSSQPGFLIYDSVFIHENIYVGDFVEHDQRRNLYRVIVGDEGVALAATVDDLDEQHRQAVKVVSAKREAVSNGLPQGLTVEKYLGLTADPQIDNAIVAKEKEITALQQANAIAKRSLLATIAIPSLPPDLDKLLNTTIDGIGAETEARVAEHVSHTGVRESWLSEGLRSVKDDACPFCGQTVSAVSLIAAFRAYFSESYGALKQKIATRMEEVNAALGDAAVERVRTAVLRNSELAAEWGDLISAPWAQTLSIDSMSAARDGALAALRQKESAPLEAQPPIGDAPAIEALRAFARDAESYNAAVTAFNLLIDDVKTKVKTGKLDDAKNDLVLMKAQRDRFSPAREALCADLEAAVSLRDDLEKRKLEAKSKLDELSDSILGAYQLSINASLAKFGASFRITKLERRYTGGTPSSSYVLQIDNANVELGDRKTDRAQPSFRNTLSGGDRSALAFAFFIAQIDRDPEIGEKIVVLDDPFTSQDRSRRAHTEQEIGRIRSKAAQVIVLSHDEAFLMDCCKHVAAEELKTLQIRRSVTGPIIREWDATGPRSELLQDHQKLKTFLVEGEADPVALRAIAAKIRLLLEAYLRGRFIGKFKDTEWLGDMIGILRKHEADLPEGAALPDELARINEYSKPYHHSNPNLDREPIDETELKTWVERTLVIADGF